MADTATATSKATPSSPSSKPRHLHPLWDRYQRITPIKPQPRDAPFIWRWRDIEPFLHRSVGEVSINDIERRALIMAHPAFGGGNDDHQHVARRLHRARARRPRPPAPPHRRGDPLRHPRGRRGDDRQRPALRDEGRRPDPHPADVLARPHQRKRPSHHLVRRRQHAADPRGRRAFLRAGRSAQQRVLAGRRRRGDVCGPRPACAPRARPRAAVNSPKYRYPGEATRRLLAAAPAGADGMRMIRYVNPATGGAVMPTLDCYAARLSKGAPTRPKRTTCNVVCLVVAGEGRSHHRRPDASNGRSTTSSPSRTGPSRATRRAAATPTSSW